MPSVAGVCYALSVAGVSYALTGQGVLRSDCRRVVLNSVTTLSLYLCLITHTHTRLTVLFPGLPGWAGTRKGKPIWILLKQETVSGSGISWAICKSVPRCRQITKPAPYHSKVFYRPDALPAAQPTVSKHWRQEHTHSITSYQLFLSNSDARRTELDSSLLVWFVNRRRIFKTSEIWIIPGIHETRRHSTRIANTIHMSGCTDTYKRSVTIYPDKANSTTCLINSYGWLAQ